MAEELLRKRKKRERIGGYEVNKNRLVNAKWKSVGKWEGERRYGEESKRRGESRGCPLQKLVRNGEEDERKGENEKERREKLEKREESKGDEIRGRRTRGQKNRYGGGREQQRKGEKSEKEEDSTEGEGRRE